MRNRLPSNEVLILRINSDVKFEAACEAVRCKKSLSSYIIDLIISDLENKGLIKVINNYVYSQYQD